MSEEYETVWGGNPDPKASLAERKYAEALEHPNQWGHIVMKTQGAANSLRSALVKLGTLNPVDQEEVKTIESKTKKISNEVIEVWFMYVCDEIEAENKGVEAEDKLMDQTKAKLAFVPRAGA